MMRHKNVAMDVEKVITISDKPFDRLPGSRDFTAHRFVGTNTTKGWLNDLVLIVWVLHLSSIILYQTDGILSRVLDGCCQFSLVSYCYQFRASV